MDPSHTFLLIGEFRICHFWLVQLLPKFTTRWYQLRWAGSRFLLQNSEVQFQAFTTTHTHKYSLNCLPCVSSHNLSYFWLLAHIILFLFLVSGAIKLSISIYLLFYFRPLAQVRLFSLSHSPKPEGDYWRRQSGKSGINHHGEGLS